MSWFKRVLEDYFEQDTNDKKDDPDIYDQNNEANEPENPIWNGSDIHSNPYGPDPNLPDPNEVNSD